MSLFARSVRPRVLVIGDVMVDEYLRGSVRRISPEAPVPVLEAGTTELLLGGAANVARNVAALGADVWLCGAVGDDALGRELEGLLARSQVRKDGIVRDPTRRTTHKLRIVSQGHQLLRVDREDKTPLTGRAATELQQRAIELVQATDIVVMSDYRKGVLSDALVRAVVDAAKRRGVPVAVDPKGSGYTRYRGASILTPNLSELEQATGLEVHDDATLETAAKRLLVETEAQAILCTCGKDGMVLVTAERPPVRILAEAREVYDVTGAGDTVIATLAFAMAMAMELEASARLANKAAGIVVGKLGTATVSRAELDTAAAAELHDKVYTRDALVRALASARTQGKRVVFTNGCFDLLHAGHVEYLEAARKLGDLLVIGLNTDASVRRLKGPSRPLVPEQARARVLAGLGCVDYVTLFDEPTPKEIIEEVRPDVLVKGGDYKPHQVVGRDFVESYGGRLELVPLSHGQSTSTIIETVLARHGVTPES